MSGEQQPNDDPSRRSETGAAGDWGQIENIQNVSVRESTIHGRGLFAEQAFSTGRILCVLDGQVIAHRGDMAVLRAHEWNAVDEERIQIRPVTTLYGFINHARDANLTIRMPSMALTACRDIAAGEELTLNYLEHGFPEIYLRAEQGSYLK